MQFNGQQQQFDPSVFGTPCRATEPQFQQFARGLAAVMNQWTALHLVAQYCDASAFQNLYQDLIDWHVRDGEVYSDELELFFEDFFGTARSVVIEDDSMKEVGDVLHDMYCRCCKDDFTRVEHFVNTEVIFRRENPVAMSVNGTGDGNDFDEDIGGLTFGEAEAAAANGEDGLYHGNEDGEGEDDGNEENENEEEAPVQRAPKNQHKKKNAAKKGADGWSTIL